MSQETKKVNDGVELDDEALDGVAGGLVQLVNPSSSRMSIVIPGEPTTFRDKRRCPVCGCQEVYITDRNAKTSNITCTIICNSCQYVYGKKMKESLLVCNG